MGRTLHFWTFEERERLRQFWGDGLSNSEIAERMGRSPQSVASQRAKKLRLVGKVGVPRDGNRKGKPSHQNLVGDRQHRPAPSPHVIQSDWLKPPTKAQLMGRR